MDKNNIRVALISVSTDLGAQNHGVEHGPKALRDQAITEKLKTVGLDVNDLGDIQSKKRQELAVGNPRSRYQDEIVRISEESASRVSQSIKAGYRMIGLGGDHSVSLGFISGASVATAGKLGVIYIDAHGDINTPDTTPTGNIHGMHLAALMGYGLTELTRVGGDGQKLKPENLLFIGGSDFDEPELKLIKDNNIASYFLFDILCNGLGPLLKKIDELCARVDRVWISFDLDSVDKEYAPAAAMPNNRGLTYREISAIAEYIGKQNNVVGVDVVEYNPANDIDYKTGSLAIELIARFLGKEYDWYKSYLAKNRLA